MTPCVSCDVITRFGHCRVNWTDHLICCCPIEELPKKVDSITPYTMALIAKYIARHRLRETRLLDAIADFLVRKAEYLDSKVRSDTRSRCPVPVCVRTLQVCLSVALR